MVLTAVVSCLQWDLSNCNWTAPAFWYSTILLSVTAIIMASQQYYVLESISPAEYEKLQTKLSAYGEKTLPPDQTMLFIWQCPIMTFCYSVVFFLAGLTSYVVSPFAANTVWGADAKVCRCQAPSMGLELLIGRADNGVLSGHCIGFSIVIYLVLS